MFVRGKYGDTYMGIVRTALLILLTLFHHVVFNKKMRSDFVRSCLSLFPPRFGGLALTSGSVTTSTSFELTYSHARVTPIKFNKQELVSY